MTIDYSELGLPNEAAIVSEAKAIAAHYIIASAQECDLQGEFSRTIEIGMKDGTHYVVQLRTEPIIEENAQQALEILGHLVPVPTRVLRDSSIVPYEYIMPRIPGVPWNEVSGWSPGFHIHVAAQLGSIIGRCCGEFPKNKYDAIDTFVIPRLEFYSKWDEPLIAPFRESIKSLLERVDDLRKLPLCWTHWDLNMMNIMVRGPDDPTITGVLDWEEAYWLPFGMNTGRISEFAANNSRGVLKKKSYSEQMTREFWAAMFLEVSSQVRELIKEVQLAKDIGSFIDTFGDGSWRPNPIHVSILQDSMTWYQVPENPLLVVDSRLSLG